MRLPNGSPLPLPNNDTLALDLTKSWDNANKTEFKNIDKGSTPVLNLEALWAAEDGKSFYAFGGIQSAILTVDMPTNPERTLSQFTPDGRGGGEWSPVATAAGSIFSFLTRSAGGLWASGSGKGFLLGGFSASNNVRTGRALPGLLSYDMASNQWRNDTATGFSDQGTAILGSMEFLLNYGGEGVLVAFGGQTADPTPIWYDTGSGLLDFQDIYIYDVATKTWHHQRANKAASDSVPDPRDMFCSVAVANDAGGYEIFVYGGQTGNFLYGPGGTRSQAILDQNAAMNEVHVLTVPGFTWFKANDTSAASRTGHTCEVAGQRQLLSLGGLDPSASTIRVSASLPDPFARGIGVFDMVDLKWKSNYDANAPPYTQPDVIKAWYRQKYVLSTSHANMLLIRLSVTAQSNGAMPPLEICSPLTTPPRPSLQFLLQPHRLRPLAHPWAPSRVA